MAVEMKAREKVDVCVIGAGHAGCEAALACARLGMETVIFTVSIDSIALMPFAPVSTIFCPRSIEMSSGLDSASS